MTESQLTKGQRTKIRMIEAATELFMQKGLYEVTFAEIAEAVGVTQPAVYRPVENMATLILAANPHWIGNAQVFIDNAINEFDSASLQLKKYVQQNLAYAYKYRSHDGLLIGLYYYSMRSKEMLQLYQDIKSGGLKRIETILRRGVRERVWRLTSPSATAYAIHSVLVGEIIKAIIEPKEEKLAERTRRVQQISSQLLQR